MLKKTTTGVAYDEQGAGDTAILCMPGWCGPRHVFDPLTQGLSDRYRTLSLDWRGHGDSDPAGGDFGTPELADDAASVIEDAGVSRVITLSAAHAGWVAIELRRRLGDTISQLVFLDWMVLGAPEPFLDALVAMKNPGTTRGVVDQIAAMWLGGLDIAPLAAYVGSMVAMDDEMWARGAREIEYAFSRYRSPIEALGGLTTPPPVLHLYAQPADPAFLEAQQGAALTHPWFEVERLEAASHFPSFEVADQIVERIDRFVTEQTFAGS